MLWATTCGAFDIRSVEDRSTAGGETTTVSCFLLTDDSRAILVDSGVGPSAARPGRLPEALGFAGVRPADIGLVVHTSSDPDHWGGDLTADGSLAFPGATLVVPHGFPDEPSAGKLAEAVGSSLEVVDEETELVPGVSVRPGLAALTVTVVSRGRRFVALGDALRHPGDVESASVPAIAHELAGTGALVAATHFPAPALGHIERLGGQLIFAPALTFQEA